MTTGKLQRELSGGGLLWEGLTFTGFPIHPPLPSSTPCMVHFPILTKSAVGMQLLALLLGIREPVLDFHIQLPPIHTLYRENLRPQAPPLPPFFKFIASVCLSYSSNMVSGRASP
jgi:hypothetical protein